MSTEFWVIIGVGVALGALLWNLTGGLRGELANIRERLARIEATQDLLVQGLHIEVRGRAGDG